MLASYSQIHRSFIDAEVSLENKDNILVLTLSNESKIEYSMADGGGNRKKEIVKQLEEHQAQNESLFAIVDGRLFIYKNPTLGRDHWEMANIYVYGTDSERIKFLKKILMAKIEENRAKPEYISGASKGVGG